MSRERPLSGGSGATQVRVSNVFSIGKDASKKTRVYMGRSRLRRPDKLVPAISNQIYHLTHTLDIEEVAATLNKGKVE